MSDKIAELIQEQEKAIVAAVAKIDQIVADRQAVQEQAKQLEQRATALAQAQNDAALKKRDAQTALEILQRVTGEKSK